jgi:hypothetical protein
MMVVPAGRAVLGSDPARRDPDLGFRVARDLE